LVKIPSAPSDGIKSTCSVAPTASVGSGSIPETQQLTTPCPHIDRSDPEHVRGKSYDVRPDLCRAYPTLAHGKRCLRGVFLGWWSTICCGVLPEWVVMDGLPLRPEQRSGQGAALRPMLAPQPPLRIPC